MSNLARLFAILERVPADELRLVVGEPPFIVNEGARRNVGSQALEAIHVTSTAAEVASAEELRDIVVGRPLVVRHTHNGMAFTLEVARSGAELTLVIRPARIATAPMLSIAPPMESMLERHTVMQEVPQSSSYGYREAVGAPSMRGPVARSVADLGSLPPPPSSREAVRPMAVEPAPILGAARVLGSEKARRSIAPAPLSGVVAVESGATGSRRIDDLLRKMLAEKASDLHLSAGSPAAMRVHGEIRFLDSRAHLTSSQIEELMRDIMPAKARGEFDELRDADFAYEIAGVARFRVNVFVDRNGVGAVLRQIPIEVLTVEQLGLPKACTDLCYLSKGLVLVTGPTGSGKSTTLAAMIDHVNKNRSDHIITIEDPVEFVHTNQKCLVNQREVGQHTKSFKNALRAALREDPDIVLVGEMRDLETIAIAIETAETGHLVFGTLHTTTAVSTVDRIIDQFPSDRQAQIRVMLSESLKGVVAQTLCKKVGGGRIAAHEILLGTSAVSALVRDGKTFQIPSVMQTSKAQGMTTMNDSLFSLVQRKLVDPKEAYIKAVDKGGLLSMYKSAGVPFSL